MDELFHHPSKMKFQLVRRVDELYVHPVLKYFEQNQDGQTVLPLCFVQILRTLPGWTNSLSILFVTMQPTEKIEG
jgi:hypothetical protein